MFAAGLRVAHQLRGPDKGVEPDVVLADEVVALALWVLPEVAPALRLPDPLRPLDRRGKVADHRVEPDVNALIVVAFQRDRDAPCDVSGDRPTAQPFVLSGRAYRDVQHVR